MRRLDFDKLNSVLLDAVLRRVGLNELYAGVSACIGLPLICFDTSFRLVAHAFNRPFYFNHWEYIAQHGGADEDAVLGNNYLVDQEKMYKNRKSLCFDSGNSSGYPQACGPVLIGDRLVAYCGIMIEDCDVEDALRANDLLAEATAVLLRETSLDVGQPELAEKLLIENELGGEAARKFASAFPPPYAFIMISVQDSGVSTLEYIRGILCAPGKQRIGCRGAEKQLYMLQYGLARGEDFSELQSITGSYGLACGVSDTFSDLAEISERRAQAMLSLTVGSGGFSTFRGSYAEIAECCAAEFYGSYASKLRSIEELAGDDQAVDRLRQDARVLSAQLQAPLRSLGKAGSAQEHGNQQDKADRGHSEHGHLRGRQPLKAAAGHRYARPVRRRRGGRICALNAD